MTKLLLIGAGGFCGAVLRYLLSGWAHRVYGGVLPVGTLSVNLVGCFALGVLMTLVERQALAPEVRLGLGVGLLGALTTFSTFGYETVELVRRGALAPALGNVAGNVVLGVAAVWAGMAAVRSLGS